MWEVEIRNEGIEHFRMATWRIWESTGLRWRECAFLLNFDLHAHLVEIAEREALGQEIRILA